MYYYICWPVIPAKGEHEEALLGFDSPRSLCGTRNGPSQPPFRGETATHEELRRPFRRDIRVLSVRWPEALPWTPKDNQGAKDTAVRIRFGTTRERPPRFRQAWEVIRHHLPERDRHPRLTKQLGALSDEGVFYIKRNPP